MRSDVGIGLPPGREPGQPHQAEANEAQTGTTLAEDRPSQPPRRARRRRLRKGLVVVIAALVAAAAIVTTRYFVRPPLGAVSRPQAVVVLDGYGPRLERGLALARRLHVHRLVVSIPPGPRTPFCPPPTRTLQVTCFVPKPQSTQGEARAVAAFARVYGWRRLLVVAGTTQVTRASVRIGRCFRGQVAYAGVDPHGPVEWGYEVLYDEAAMVKALVWQRSC